MEQVSGSQYVRISSTPSEEIFQLRVLLARAQLSRLHYLFPIKTILQQPVVNLSGHRLKDIQLLSPTAHKIPGNGLCIE